MHELLAAAWSDGPAPTEDAPVGKADVARALAELRAGLRGDPLLPVGPLTDQMLDLWAVVKAYSPAATRPVEAFLGALSTRQMVAAEEVDAVCAEIERAVAHCTPAP